MTPDEVRLLDNDDALLFIRGERPVRDKKYDLLQHKNIHQTEDGGGTPYHHETITTVKFANADLKHAPDNNTDWELMG